MIQRTHAELREIAKSMVYWYERGRQGMKSADGLHDYEAWAYAMGASKRPK